MLVDEFHSDRVRQSERGERGERDQSRRHNNKTKTLLPTPRCRASARSFPESIFSHFNRNATCLQKKAPRGRKKHQQNKTRKRRCSLEGVPHVCPGVPQNRGLVAIRSAVEVYVVLSVFIERVFRHLPQHGRNTWGGKEMGGAGEGKRGESERDAAVSRLSPTGWRCFHT